MGSVWRKFGLRQNDSNQAIVDDPGGLICKVSSQMRDYQPPHSGNSLVSVSVCIYGTGTITMARRAVLFPTSNWRVLGCTKETHTENELWNIDWSARTDVPLSIQPYVTSKTDTRQTNTCLFLQQSNPISPSSYSLLILLPRQSQLGSMP